MLLVPFIGFIAGFGWANFGIAVAARMNSIDNFSYVISAVLTPLFLVAGTFFPIDGLPEWAQVAAQLNPLYHLVQLVRDAVFGFEPVATCATSAFLVGFGLLTWRLAIRWMTQQAHRLYGWPAGRARTGPSSTPRTRRWTCSSVSRSAMWPRCSLWRAAQDLGGEQPHEAAVELRAGDVAQLVLGLGRRHLDPVGVRRGQHVVDLGDGEDARGHRDASAARPSG